MIVTSTCGAGDIDVVRLDGCSIKMVCFDDYDDGLYCSYLRSNLRYILCVVTPEPLV